MSSGLPSPALEGDGSSGGRAGGSKRGGSLMFGSGSMKGDGSNSNRNTNRYSVTALYSMAAEQDTEIEDELARGENGRLYASTSPVARRTVPEYWSFPFCGLFPHQQPRNGYET